MKIYLYNSCHYLSLYFQFMIYNIEYSRLHQDKQ